MPNPTENTPDPGELERLRAHAADLLRELKEAKAKNADLRAQLDAANSERDAAVADVRALRLDAPVNRMLEEIASPGTAPLLAQLLTTRGYRFDLDGTAPVILDAEGKPATVIDPAASKNAPPSKPRPAKFDAEDLKLLMTEAGKPEAERHALVPTFNRFIVVKASGGSATGSGGKPNATPATPEKPAPKPASAPKAFGLT
jgi:hypothetical protein